MLKKKAASHSSYDTFMREYLQRLAFGLAQFWGVGETLPDKEAAESEIFYRVSIRRLAPSRRVELVRMMRTLCTARSRFFTPETPMAERRELIGKVVERFGDLSAAAHEIDCQSNRI